MGKHWGVWAAALLLAVSVSGCGEKAVDAPAKVAIDPAFEAEQQQWRQQRYEQLHAADGWTSLVGLHWLEYKAHYIGRGPGSGIRLAVGPDKLGMVAREGDTVWFTPERGVAMQVDGKPVTGRIRFFSDRDPTPTVIAFDDGKGRLSLIHRGERFALRVKHADAPSRTNFTGLTYWPGGASWRVTARSVSYKHLPAHETLS